MVKTRTLHLNLHHKWFYMILNGEKKEEYRELSDYWKKRLTTPSPIYGIKYKEFDTITFSNGYAKDRDQFTIEHKATRKWWGRTDWGAEPYKQYFVIHLGDIIETNLKSHKATPKA